jgi:Domain of unknown function (DUF4177)
MRNFEYKAIPAPTRGSKAKGVKTTEDRFALSLSETLNEMAGEGWEYVRAETLPCDERKGLTGTQTTYQNLLIFRRFKSEAQPLALGTQTVAPPIHATGDHVTPRRVTSRPPEEGVAPALGSARDDY